MRSHVRKVVLAYSGDRDTSIIIPWLNENYGCEVIAMAGNVGQEDSLFQVEQRALKAGASKVYIEDLRRDFVAKSIWPLIRSGAQYEGRYLPGTAILQPLLAERQVEIARRENADAVVHGCRGKGDGHIRFERTYRALAPHLEIITPCMEWDIQTAGGAAAYAAEHNIPISEPDENGVRRESNLWHTRQEGGVLDDLGAPLPADLYHLTLDPDFCPEGQSEITIDFEQGIPVGLNGNRLPPVQLIEDLNEIAGTNGVGRVDIIESGIGGIKSRRVYEIPGGTLIAAAHYQLESICLDRQTRSQRDIFGITYGQMLTEGQWHAPLKQALDSFFVKIQETVTGSVTLGLYRGTIVVKNRLSPGSFYGRDDSNEFVKLIGRPAPTEWPASVKTHEIVAGTF